MADRVAGVVAIVIAAGMMLTGCVPAPPDPIELPTPAPTGTPSPQASAAPAPEPVVDVDAVVTHLVVRPEHLDLADSAGLVVSELSYDADAESFVDAMSDVLGGPPDVEERPGGHEWWPTTRYTWPGVTVVDDHEREGITMDMNLSVQFTHPVVGNGISVSTIQGFRPGDDARAFAAELEQTWSGSGYESFPAETGPEVGERGYDAWTETYWEHANANAVAVNVWSGSQPPVTSVILAPWNFGIGHV